MNRSIRILLLALAALLVAPAATPAATPPLRSATVVDDLGLPLRGWAVTSRPGMRTVTFPGAPWSTGASYAYRSRALRLTPGGSIARALPERPWSLSLDFRVARGSILRAQFGSQAITFETKRNGDLRVGTGGSHINLAAHETGPSGWHHLEVAGFDPVEVHVNGTRIAHGIEQGRRLALRTLRGAAQVTGLVATRRDDRRALLLHRLASMRSQNLPRRLPTTVAPEGDLRYEGKRDDGFYPGALWNAYGLTGARLFRNWGERATFDQFELNDRKDPPAHWQGLRVLESMAQADRRTCAPAPRQHRCRLLRKGVDVELLGMSNGNPGTWAIPSLLWPRMCPSCRSSDEVEIRIETMMDVGLMEWHHTLHRYAVAQQPNRQINPSRHGPRAIEHAKVVERLLVRDDGSTFEGVRTNRVDGTVLSYEGGDDRAWYMTWARGHAGALYGFARTGARFGRTDLIAVSERMARYLEANLPPERIPRRVFSLPAPFDPDTGALYAAGLLRLAEACERLSGACTDGPRWRALGDEMLAAYLARLNTHIPVGATPGEGQALYGMNYALEAVERSARLAR